ncbi:protein kinase [Myxococcus sp. RHSTA-1-4]|uniref:protein kinase domain-containing protein n=1 Tax=Myxococcus sp. RHSTA-1-4 TaxID=2874601 RepID=UPI001CBDA7A5|nr:protein kinase [Myxococcus sp. RHSTA-1-4]MBZ4417602.1 protein kinase [Myxococcus sp. RHSTA-1-4]
MSGNTLPLAPDARLLGKYEVLCRLSTGGMAEIFLASQRGLAGFRKLVVLKQILPDIRGEEEFVRMFLDEAKVTAAFNHPHIAQVYDLDIAEGELFLSMEFVPGATLVEVARACRQNNMPIPMGFSLMAVRDTAVALHYAHTFTDPLGHPSPVIHRDVAEKNIMVTYEGVTKLLDFGIAKSLARASRTAVGMVKGTSGYMSPEQIMGEPLDARSDLFSLGVVLHECLTGMRLFYAKQAEAMMNAVLRCEVTPPSRTNKNVPPELDAIVMRALARKRADRYASTLEFARALERAVGPSIWHPEQSSELMRRLFADRREQTRQLLMAGQATSGDNTGVMSLARVLAMGSESAEAPTVNGGAAPAPSAPPPPARTSTTVPATKAPATTKPAAPPPGAPAPRRPTVTAPAYAPPPTEEGGTVRARPPLAAPPQKRVPPRTMSGEVSRPPPPPSEAMTPPPPPSDDAELSVRTQPGRPALPPEFTLRAQQPDPVHAPEEATSVVSTRGPESATSASEEPPRAEPRPRARNTLEGMRAVGPPAGADEPARAEARPRARTLDNARAAAAPAPPAERDLQTAMLRAPAPVERGVPVRTPAPPPPPPERDVQTTMARTPTPPPPPPERDVQTAMVRAPTPPPPPPEREFQTAMVRAPAPPPPPPEREFQTAMVRAPAPVMRDAQAPLRMPAPVMRDAQAPMARSPAPAPENQEESVSITPTYKPRRGRRRSPPPPPFAPPDVTTEPVRSMVRSEDPEDATLDDYDAHETTQRGTRAHRREQRSRAWAAVAAVLLLVLGLGAVAVLLGLDKGRVSAVLKPALARLGVGPKAGNPEPAGSKQGSTPAPAESGTQVKPKAVAGTVPADGAATGTPSATAPDPAKAMAGADAARAAPTTLTDAAGSETPGTAPSADPERSLDEGTPPEESPAPKKTRNVAKRSREAPARKPRGSEAAPATAAEAGSEAAPAGEPGFLTLVTEPYAKVFLGGQELGDTPLFKVKLPSGKHTLKLVDGNEKAHRLPVDIKPGETTAVRIPLAMLSSQ